MTYPFTILLGLVTSFRLSDAFGKWVKGSEILHAMSRDCRLAVSRMVAYLDAGEPESAELARVALYVPGGALDQDTTITLKESADLAAQTRRTRLPRLGNVCVPLFSVDRLAVARGERVCDAEVQGGPEGVPPG